MLWHAPLLIVISRHQWATFCPKTPGLFLFHCFHLWSELIADSGILPLAALCRRKVGSLCMCSLCSLTTFFLHYNGENSTKNTKTRQRLTPLNRRTPRPLQT